MDPQPNRFIKLTMVLSWLVYLIAAYFLFILSLLGFDKGFSFEALFFVIVMNGIPLIVMVLMSVWAIRTGSWVRSILSLPAAILFYFIPIYLYKFVDSKPLLRLENFVEEKSRDINLLKFRIEKATEDRSKCTPVENSGNYTCP